MLNTMILYAITCFTGAMIQSLCGFGSGMVLMSALPHFIHSYSFSLVLSTLASLVTCVSIVAKEYRHINVRMIIPVIIGNVVAITSVMLFWSGDADSAMKKILGGFLILLSLYFVFLNRNIRIKPTLKAGLLTGLIGGTANAFFSMGGPPIALYMMAASKNTKEYIASSQAYFCFSAIYVTISRYMRGMVTNDVWPFILAGVPLVAIGTWVGLKLFGLLNEEKLRFTIYIFMAASGAVMILTN
ncbi:MAG: sulfite exporter TauE/SafE family protein [Synergistaceae bacterium]|nr:sulfite exporter TauE/SafE family protein [Synergistaceae bacterium]